MSRLQRLLARLHEDRAREATEIRAPARDPPAPLPTGTAPPPRTDTPPGLPLFWRAVLDALETHVAVIDARGEIVATNRAWVAFAHANRFVGDPERGNYLAVCDRAVGPGAEDARRMAAALRAMLVGAREHFAMQYPCHAPYEPRWYTARISRSTDYLVIAHENVTAEILAAQSLRRSEERFRTVVEHSPEVVAILDQDGRVTYVSPNVRGVAGHGADAAIGRPIDDFIHPDDRTAVDECLAELLGGRRELATFPALRLAHAERGWIRIEATVRNLLHVRAVHGLMINFRDVSERLDAEDRLRAGEQRLRLALAVAHAGVWEADVERGEMFWSEESYRLIGYEPYTVTPSVALWLGRVHPDDRERVAREAQRLMAEPSDFHVDVRVCLPTAGVRWISCIGRVTERDAQDRVRRLLGLQIDITDRMRRAS